MRVRCESAVRQLRVHDTSEFESVFTDHVGWLKAVISRFCSFSREHHGQFSAYERALADDVHVLCQRAQLLRERGYMEQHVSDVTVCVWKSMNAL